MSANIAQELLLAIRNVLVLVSGFPTPVWSNTAAYDPTATTPFAEDMVVALDTEYIELGSDSRQRSVMVYRIIAHMALGTDIMAGLTLSSAIKNAFRDTTMTVSSQEVFLADPQRVGPIAPDARWLNVPVTLTFHVTHS